MTLPYSIVWDSPCQVCLVVVVGEVSIDFLQQQVRPGRGKDLQFYAFFCGGGLPPLHSRQIPFVVRLGEVLNPRLLFRATRLPWGVWCTFRAGLLVPLLLSSPPMGGPPPRSLRPSVCLP